MYQFLKKVETLEKKCHLTEKWINFLFWHFIKGEETGKESRVYCLLNILHYSVSRGQEVQEEVLCLTSQRKTNKCALNVIDSGHRND